MDLDPGATVDNKTIPVNSSVVTKFSSANVYQYSNVYSDGVNVTNSRGIELTPNGSLIVDVAFTGSIDVDPSATVNTITAVGSTDDVIIRMSPANAFVSAANIGSAAFDNTSIIASSNDNTYYYFNYYLTGNVIDLDPTAGVNNFTTPSNGFLIGHLDTSGNYLGSIFINATSSYTLFSMYFNSTNNTLDIVGNVSGALVDFDPSASVNSPAVIGSNDNFFARYNADLTLNNAYRWGSTSLDIARGMAIGKTGSKKVAIISNNNAVGGDTDPDTTTNVMGITGNYITVMDDKLVYNPTYTEYDFPFDAVSQNTSWDKFSVNQSVITNTTDIYYTLYTGTDGTNCTAGTEIAGYNSTVLPSVSDISSIPTSTQIRCVRIGLNTNNSSLSPKSNEICLSHSTSDLTTRINTHLNTQNPAGVELDNGDANVVSTKKFADGLNGLNLGSAGFELLGSGVADMGNIDSNSNTEEILVGAPGDGGIGAIYV